MKKILLKFEIYYEGNLTSKHEIGALTIELVLDEDRIKKGLQFIESENDVDFDDYNEKLPINYTTIYVKSANVIQTSNIKANDERFEYSINDGYVKLTTRGEDVILQMGYPIEIGHYSI